MTKKIYCATYLYQNAVGFQYKFHSLRLVPSLPCCGARSLKPRVAVLVWKYFKIIIYTKLTTPPKTQNHRWGTDF
jgi:hypothetical protein